MSTCKLIAARATTVNKRRYVRALYSVTDKTYETNYVLPFITIWGYIDKLQTNSQGLNVTALSYACANINDMPYLVKPEEQKLIEQALFWEKIKN